VGWRVALTDMKMTNVSRARLTFSLAYEILVLNTHQKDTQLHEQRHRDRDVEGSDARPLSAG
jgi:hypothetical protein